MVSAGLIVQIRTVALFTSVDLAVSTGKRWRRTGAGFKQTGRSAAKRAAIKAQGLASLFV